MKNTKTQDTKKVIDWKEFMDKMPIKSDDDFRPITDDEMEKLMDQCEVENGIEQYISFINSDGEYVLYEEWLEDEFGGKYHTEFDTEWLWGAYNYYVISQDVARFICKYSYEPVLYNNEIGYVLPLYFFTYPQSVNLTVDDYDNLWG